ncbi:hypothetical protein ACJIZ3_015046 [Penstemon smallii]|uniref:EamA domain-containing protein n=1 Tax=Penstemon smallii TaxID=265156 RepID=A0ABD3RLL3_9LAMI
MARGRYFFYREILPFAALVTAECTNVGVNILYKAAVNKGLSYHVYMVYSYAISALLMIPLAYFFHRKTVLPQITVVLLGKFFILGFLGMEKLKLRSLSSQAKIIGTAVTIAGAIVVVLYKGPLLITTHNDQLKLPLSSIVLRAKVVKEYPAVFVIVFFYNLSAFIISVPVCMISEPNFTKWKVPADVRLLSILYSGIMGSGFGIMVHTWGLHVKGPVYVALFRPLSIAIAAILGVIFLGDNLYLGSVIGSLIISFGFYTVIWGKSNEGKNDDVSNGYNIESPNDASLPLLIGKVDSEMARGRDFYREILPFAALVTAECTNVGSSILYKAALNKGLSYHVYMVYTYAIAALLMIPLAYFFHRMEKLKLRSLSSQAKIIGTAVTIAGAIVVVLYKGPLLITTHNDQLKLPLSSIVLRVKVVEEYPAVFVLVFFLNLFAFIISVPVCMISEPNLTKWNVPADVRLLSILYSGIVGSAFGLMVNTWGLHVKGPVYVALFRPLSIAITVILGVIFLGDNLYLGSVIGSLIISFGFYTVIWGKSNEEKNDDICNGYNIESPNDAVAPLLNPLK